MYLNNNFGSVRIAVYFVDKKYYIPTPSLYMPTVVFTGDIIRRIFLSDNGSVRAAIPKLVHGKLDVGLRWLQKNCDSKVVREEFWEYARNIASRGPPKPVKFFTWSTRKTM